MPSTLLVTVKDRIASISINRPDRRNVLNSALIRELQEAISNAGKDEAVRIVVLTGTGSAFCGGMDIQELEQSISKTHEDNVHDANELMRLLHLIQGLRKPVIAMVNGPAMGGGCGLAAACDFVFAAETSARFGVPEVRLGFVPAVIMLFLIRRMGEGRAREFVLQGETADAKKALLYGLASRIVPDKDLSSEVTKFASDLASTTSPSSIMLTKDLLHRISGMGYREAVDFAVSMNAIARKTPDFKKGVESFLNKESLKW